MNRLSPGTAIRVTDFSADPRGLLRDLADPLRSLRDSQQLPVLHLRRGWRHGSHLAVHVGTYPNQLLHSDEFVSTAHAIAAARGAGAPPENEYLARAEQLARWENVDADLLPLHVQGHVDVRPHVDRPGTPAVLARARDLICSRYLEPILGSLSVADDEMLAHLTGVLAVLARSHPRGIAIGTLALRSHIEGVSSATGRHTDLRAAFTRRFPHDEGVFTAAMTEPISDPLLLAWQRAYEYGWGVGEALAAEDLLNERVMNTAPGRMEYPMGPPVRSDFIAEYIQNRLAAEPTFRQVAYRLLLNTVYASLTCFGITPFQRYYLCFGLSEVADQLTGRSSTERMRDQRPLAS